MKFSNKFIVNLPFILINKVFSVIATLFISSITLRHLGPDQNGIMVYSLSLISPIIVLSQFGIENGLFDYFIKQKDFDKAFSNAIYLRIIVSLFFFILFNIFSSIFSIESEVRYLNFINSFLIIFSSFDIITTYLISLNKYRFTIFINITAVLINLLLKILFTVYINSNLFVFSNLTLYFSSFVFSILSIITFARFNSFNFRIVTEIFKISINFMLSGFFVSLYVSAPIFLLRIINISDSYTYITYLNLLTSFLGIWHFLPQSIISFYKPKIFSNTINLEVKYFQNILLYVSGSWFFFFSFIVLFGKHIFTLLYGESFIFLVDYSSFFLISSFFSSLGQIKDIYFIHKGKGHLLKYISLFGILSIVALTLILFPFYGFLGIIISILINEIMIQIIYPAVILGRKDHYFIFLTKILGSKHEE
jgi:O-antigen/teichoic acid export membrane protein